MDKKVRESVGLAEACEDEAQLMVFIHDYFREGDLPVLKAVISRIISIIISEQGENAVEE